MQEHLLRWAVPPVFGTPCRLEAVVPRSRRRRDIRRLTGERLSSMYIAEWKRTPERLVSSRRRLSKEHSSPTLGLGVRINRELGSIKDKGVEDN